MSKAMTFRLAEHLNAWIEREISAEVFKDKSEALNNLIEACYQRENGGQSDLMVDLLAENRRLMELILKRLPASAVSDRTDSVAVSFFADGTMQDPKLPY